MLTYAYHDGNKISIDEYQNEMKGKISCSEGHELMAKKGKIKVHHFCHKKQTECFCCRDMSDWHILWQKFIKKDNVEVIIIKNQKKHIADCVLSDGTVVEFQRSIISEVIIKERETFYNKMFWIFDISRCNFVHKFEEDKVILTFTSGNLFFLNAKPPFYLDTGKKKMIYVKEIKANKKIIGTLVNFRKFVQEKFSEILEDNENLSFSREEAPDI